MHGKSGYNVKHADILPEQTTQNIVAAKAKSNIEEAFAGAKTTGPGRYIQYHHRRHRNTRAMPSTSPYASLSLGWEAMARSSSTATIGNGHRQRSATAIGNDRQRPSATIGSGHRQRSAAAIGSRWMSHLMRPRSIIVALRQQPLLLRAVFARFSSAARPRALLTA